MKFGGLKLITLATMFTAIIRFAPARGAAQSVRRINHPDRLNYPMKRAGRRGEGKFERISWQESTSDTISASRKDRSIRQCAVYIHYSSGIVGGNITRRRRLPPRR